MIIGWNYVAPDAESFYKLSLQEAIQIAKEKLAEWSFEDDPHGYCHERPILMKLVRAADILMLTNTK